MRWLLIFALCGYASATSYTVKGSGGSYTTISACAAVAVAGDTCTVFASASPQSGWTQPTSGSAGNLITFVVNTGDSVTVTSSITVSGRSYLLIRGFNLTAADKAISADSSTTNVTVDGNTGAGTRMWFCADGAGSGCSNNVISNNVVTRTSTSTTSPAFYIYGDSNRIEGNTVTGGTSDFINVGGANVVIRNNLFTGPDGTASGEHVDFVQVVGGPPPTFPTLAFSLVENNVEKNCVNQCHLIIVRTGSGPVADTVIVRENYIYNMGNDGSGASYGGVGDSAPHGWFYNNTIASLGTTAENGDCVSYQNATNGVVLNNICYHTQADSYSATVGLSFGNANLGFNSGYSGSWNSPYSTESTYAALHNQDPLFANYPTSAALSVDSPALGSGVALTTASGSGSSSTTLTVADAHGLQPGWAGTNGDWIRIGTSTTRQISAINYSTNVVTIASASWADGDPIYLYKNSSGTQVLFNSSPDIGAVAFVPTSSTFSSGSTVRSGATISN